MQARIYGKVSDTRQQFSAKETEEIYMAAFRGHRVGLYYGNDQSGGVSHWVLSHTFISVVLFWAQWRLRETQHF